MNVRLKVGLLGLANKPGGFDKNDAHLAAAFGELASIALFNSRTLESLVDSEERFSWVDLGPLTHKVLSICQNKIKKTVKLFIREVPEELPKIYTDPYSLEQVLINMLLNAAQAADKPDSWVKLTIAVNDEWKDHAIIQVSDNGCGISDDVLLKIFDPFFTTKLPPEGTGLGLYVCHNLVESMGGRIEVESKRGEGTTFTVILPDKDKERRQKTRI
jgi:signal transduction histidine kinase